jgi:cell wall-associated NlpC family hydrolase
MFVYGKAGVSLPHNSGRQFNSVERVPVEKMKPGDLVFSGGRSIHHVGLYIGDGKMIHSPQSGRRVEVAPLRGNVRGAGRPAS